MKKEMIVLTSTSWDNDEFNECWMICSNLNVECFNSVTIKKNEIAFHSGDFLLHAIDGNDYYNKAGWDYSKIQQKVESMVEGMKENKKNIHLLLHSDNVDHLFELKKRFDEKTCIHIYSSGEGDLWDYLVLFSEPKEQNEVNVALVNLWERLDNPPADADLKKNKDLMFAIKHTLAKSRRQVREFSEYCIKKHPEDLAPQLGEKIMGRLEKTKTSFSDCLDKEILLTDVNEHISVIYQYFRKIEKRALKIKSTGLKRTEKINMGFHCADDFSKILDIINQAKDR